LEEFPRVAFTDATTPSPIGVLFVAQIRQTSCPAATLLHPTVLPSAVATVPAVTLTELKSVEL